MVTCEWIDCDEDATQSSNDDVLLCEEHYDLLCDEWADMQD